MAKKKQKKLLRKKVLQLLKTKELKQQERK